MATSKGKSRATGNKPGRPTTFTPVMAERIVSLLWQGHSLKKISEMEGMPSDSTIDGWMEKDAEFSGRCAQARAHASDRRVDEIIDIADDQTIPPDHKKHMISTRQWMAEKLMPKKYGQKVELNGRLTYEQLVGQSLEPTE